MFLCFFSRLEPSSCNGDVASTEDNLNSSGASTEPSNASGLSTEIWETIPADMVLFRHFLSY